MKLHSSWTVALSLAIAFVAMSSPCSAQSRGGSGRGRQSFKMPAKKPSLSPVPAGKPKGAADSYRKHSREGEFTTPPSGVKKTPAVAYKKNTRSGEFVPPPSKLKKTPATPYKKHVREGEFVPDLKPPVRSRPNEKAPKPEKP